MTNFVDFHCHSSMKSYAKGLYNPEDESQVINSSVPEDLGSIWNTNSFGGELWREAVQRIAGVAKYKEADMQRMHNGGVRLVIISITPPEVGFFRMNQLKLVELFDNLLGHDMIPDFVTEFGKRRIQEIENNQYDYFQDLNREYNFVAQLDNFPIVDLNNWKYVLAQRDRPMHDQMAANPNSTVIVFSVEGGHSLFSGQANEMYNKYDIADLNNPDSEVYSQLWNMLKENIKALKQWGDGAHCPLYLTLNHHFWNMLAGHSTSLADVLTKLLDQTPHLNSGMTCLGMAVVDELLSTDNGPRILIDAKHLSPQARQWFYSHIAELNAGKNDDEKIPIISSHTGANGYSNILNSDEGEYDASEGVIANEKYRASNVLNNWGINLSDEEIKSIYDSGGIIGISLDRRIITGYNEMETVKRNDDWAKPVLNQLKYIYNVLKQYSNNPERSLATMCLGSDFDGIINPLNHYITADTLDKLYQDLISDINVALAEDPNPFAPYDKEKVLDAFFYDNAVNFVERYFR